MTLNFVTLTVCSPSSISTTHLTDSSSFLLHFCSIILRITWKDCLHYLILWPLPWFLLCIILLILLPFRTPNYFWVLDLVFEHKYRNDLFFFFLSREGFHFFCHLWAVQSKFQVESFLGQWNDTNQDCRNYFTSGSSLPLVCSSSGSQVWVVLLEFLFLADPRLQFCSLDLVRRLNAQFSCSVVSYLVLNDPVLKWPSVLGKISF